MRADPFNPWMRPMRVIHVACIGSFVLLVLALPLVVPLPPRDWNVVMSSAILLPPVMFLALIVTVFLAGRHEGGTGCGLGHAALIFVLLPAWGVGVLFVPPLLKSDLERRRRLDGSMPPACERCGYDLRATPRGGRCPECGEPAAQAAMAPPTPTAAPTTKPSMEAPESTSMPVMERAAELVMPSDPLNPWLRPMMIARGACIGIAVSVTLVGIVGISSSWAMSVAVGLLLAGLADAVAVVVLVFLAGRREFGLSYALGHAALTLILCPALGAGFLLVPLMVKSDIEKRRRAAGLMPPECAGCGCDLRTTPPDGRCPECGRLVAESMRHEEARIEAG